jgi:putative flippase GtrA
MLNRINHSEFFRYCISGSISAVIDWSLFFLLAIVMKLHYEIALVISFLLSAMANYTLNRDYVFKNTSPRFIRQFTSYCGLVLLTLVISGLLLHLLIRYLAQHEMMARILVTLLLGAMNYGLNKLIPFNRKLFNQEQ